MNKSIFIFYLLLFIFITACAKNSWRTELPAEPEDNDPGTIHVQKYSEYDSDDPTRYIYTIAVDSDQKDTTNTVVIIDELPVGFHLDGDPTNKYGNIFIDSALPTWGPKIHVELLYKTDTSTNGNWLPLTRKSSFLDIRSVKWEMYIDGYDKSSDSAALNPILAPHNNNDSQDITDGVDTSFASKVDDDAMFVRFSVRKDEEESD